MGSPAIVGCQPTFAPWCVSKIERCQKDFTLKWLPPFLSSFIMQLGEVKFSCSIDQIRRISVENIASIVNQWSFKNEGILKSVDISDNVLFFFEIHQLFLYTIMDFGGDFWGYVILSQKMCVLDTWSSTMKSPQNQPTTEPPFLLYIHGVSTAGSFSTPRMNFTSACWLEKSEGSSVDDWDSLTWWWILFLVKVDFVSRKTRIGYKMI